MMFGDPIQEAVPSAVTAMKMSHPSRLQTLWPDIAAAVVASDPVEARCLAVEVARVAVSAVGLEDDRLSFAFLTPAGGDTHRGRIEELMKELDQIYFDISDRRDTGLVDDEIYLRAYRRARAAAAAWAATDPDPHRAALEAIYEAHAAVTDTEGLRSFVRDCLLRCAEHVPDSKHGH